ncbi:alpha/beta fold hydrolase [Atopobium fossor]|uniref:alpha/beta fold hydrolase n=1 Tax=Atopobium fossor TaxID=39487 RepID=UPI000402FF1B|nr:alpha/beta hydrolase [Atopobium fossor]
MNTSTYNDANNQLQSELPSFVLYEPLSFISADGTTTCRGHLWLPAKNGQSVQPKLVVQIAHGMAEHIARYQSFAHVLCQQGIAACGIDHLGHGATTPDSACRGIYDLACGAQQLIQDQHSLRKLVQQRFSQLPYVLFGHSMGSFVARAYLTQHAQGLAGAIIMGTNWQVGPAALKLFLASQACIHGWGYRSKMVDNLAAGGYNKKITLTSAEKTMQQQGKLNGYEWLSRDPQASQAYADDQACGWIFSLSGYKVVADLLQQAQNSKAIARIPQELPIFIISGEKDPVGANGAGPVRVFKAYRKAGLDRTELEIIAGARHELLNELEPDRSNVIQELIDWLEKNIHK